MSISEPLSFNGADLRPHPSSDGRPEPRHCRDCAWEGRGAVQQAEHWRQTGHTIRYGKRPALVVVCSWCPDAMRKTLDAKKRGDEVTHGMCIDCARKWK